MPTQTTPLPVLDRKMLLPVSKALETDEVAITDWLKEQNYYADLL